LANKARHTYTISTWANGMKSKYALNMDATGKRYLKEKVLESVVSISITIQPYTTR
jgi:hypothetical protein